MIFDGDRDFIGPYLRYLADNMGLRDWFLYHQTASPQDEELGQEAKATCSTEYGQKVAAIGFRDDWPQSDEEEFRWTCVHELLHCHFRPVQQPILDAETLLGKMAHTPIYHAFNTAMEYCVDAIAYEWARHLLLPSEWLELETEPEGMA